MPTGVYVRTQEHRQHISEVMKGRKPWTFGIHLSEETKQKISVAKKGSIGWNRGLKGYSSEWNRGRKRSLEYRLSISGPNCRFWKGGITQINTLIRHSREYGEWRKAVFERDDYRCYDCGARGVKLEADHILPFSNYPRLRFDVQNGRTLCKECHHKTPTFGRRALQFPKVAISI